METSMLLKFKNWFEEEKKNLLYSKKILSEEFQINTDELADEVDLTSFEIEQSMRIRLRNREALYLKKIESSLERIKNGTFGECECGEEIELRRLEARPTTTLCVSCKEEQESQEHRHIDGRAHKSVGDFRLKLA